MLKRNVTRFFMAIDREIIRQSLDLQEAPSVHLKTERWLLWTKRHLTEMLEHYHKYYAFEGDRDNDPTFIPHLMQLGLDHKRIYECPFQKLGTEVRIASYPLRFSSAFALELEGIRAQKGWTRQTLMANLVYTGLLLSYPQYPVGKKVKIYPLEYVEMAYQPNRYWLQFTGKNGVIAEVSRVADPWELVSIPGHKDLIKVRKDWVFTK